MKLTAAIPNVYLASLAVIFVLIGTITYNPNAKPPPVKENEVPAVLSQTQTENPQAETSPAAMIPVLPTELPLLSIPIPEVIPTPLTPQPPAPSDASLIQTQADTAIQDLENSDTASMINLLSSDLTSTYSAADLENAFAASGQQVLSFRNLGDPNITGDYADQNVEVTTTTGTYNFQVFLHKESGTWKIMGTEPLP